MPLIEDTGSAVVLYCSVAQARAAGATGTDAEVESAIRAARGRIDRYTGDAFAPTTLTVVTRVRPDGTALLPRVVRTVDAVRAVGSPSDLDPAAYRVLSSLTLGQVDAVVVGGASPGGDPIIAGAEPWNGGWANLLGSLATGQLEVTGTFGWDEPPTEVVNAAAMLAADIRNGTVAVAPAGPDTDDEGNVVKVTVGESTSRLPGQRSTGNASADALLVGLIRSRLRLSF